uniref:Uncharacterized protein n=1 Tax=Paramormyrops kingsleyae TaxID=1676925 RepID=A0A3B3T982_9TELE
INLQSPPACSLLTRSKEGQVLHRTKRGWVWNQFFVIEEYTGPDPVLVGRSAFSILTDWLSLALDGHLWVVVVPPGFHVFH